MSSRHWLIAGGAVAAVAIFVIALGIDPRGDADRAIASPSASLVPRPTAGGTAAQGPTEGPVDSPPATPDAPVATDPPLSSGAPAAGFAAFLLRVNEDRAKVAELNEALGTAVEAQDTEAGRAASVDILDFVDREREWLREHPPAGCYAAAHAASGAMLDAYGTAAERFVDWSNASGLAGLAALGDAIGAAQAGADALTAFETVLDGTRCPA